MKFYASNDIDSIGTSLQGYVTTTQLDLIDTFGEPTRCEADYDKVTLEWVIYFETDDMKDQVATIYDWKRYDAGTPGLDEIYEYHIGGHSREVVSLVKEAIHSKSKQVLS